jgi:pimeloyl-ACP methyl ester carboxylesterase
MNRLPQGGWILVVFLYSTLTAQGQSPDRGNFNLVTPTMGGTQFWADQLLFQQYRIQKNVLTGHCRLLDPEERRLAWGSFEQCKTALEQEKKINHLSSLKGHAVIVLHGLGGWRGRQKSLCDYLRTEGGYQVFAVSYPSTQADIAEHARTLAKVIDGLEGIESIEFVAHSMGNVIVRRYLYDLQHETEQNQTSSMNEKSKKQHPQFRRFVMLGPPNHGADVAERLGDKWIVKEVIGEAGRQLGREWDDLEKTLATPAFEFAVIAGGKNAERGMNPLLAGDNDGLLTVETTKLAGARDFIVLPAIHPTMMNYPDVRECTLRFLKQGYLVSEEKRHPLE